ncbi:hypothetical protein K1T71_009806 [Dendrolimus kikuchii]|uniref:Uncharacterized protein n=1 Tax=Dendrolimus kikuchii TaxID=765133 RepID=A0ACC1CSR3_9NEOP|nr:hypothetical protein K1T71_009806 [Dendrolimus kikuchii]
MNFSNKVVLVTGASSGIGAAIAIKFSEQGAKVALVGRNETKLSNVSKKCADSGGEPLVILADITNNDDAKRIISETIGKFGKLDVLVNNAGICTFASITALQTMDVFDKVMATNLRSAVYITHLCVGYLEETKGNIINISSIAGLAVLSKQLFAYSTSKAALDHFTRCIALELASKGVRVNSVNPGPVKTDIYENSGYNEATEQIIWETMKKATAVDRITEPEEIADLVLFLTSDKAKSITGSVYVADNGMLLKGGGEN